MQVTSIASTYNNKKFSFEVSHQAKNNNTYSDSEYNSKEKLLIAGMSALGVATSIALLAKCKKTSFLSYFKNAKFEEAQIISMGAGSCLGGFIGGSIVDKNPENRKLKKREAVMQIGNVSIPVVTVGAFSRIAKKFGKIPQAIGAVAGLFTGVFLSNVLMNSLSDAIFKTNKRRPVKLSDFSAHIDDMLMAASFVSEAPLIQKLARVIPFALIVAGYETGTQKVKE